MIIDIILASIIFVWAVIGYRKGFIHRAFALIGVIFVAAFSAPLANILNAIITIEFNIPLNEHYAKTALLAASACIIYIACYFLGRFLYNNLVKGIKLAEKTNKILGTILGILVICIHINKVETYIPPLAREIHQSYAGTFVSQNNFVELFELFSPNKKSEIPQNTDPQASESQKDEPEQTKELPEQTNDQPEKDTSERDTTAPSDTDVNPSVKPRVKNR